VGAIRIDRFALGGEIRRFEMSRRSHAFLSYAAVAFIACFALGVGGPPVVSARSQTTAMTSAGTIVIQLRGVIALYNPRPQAYPITHALLPRDRGKQTARDDPKVPIPAHRPFIRFPMDGGFLNSSARKPDEVIEHKGKNGTRKYGIVFVDGEQLFIVGGAPNPLDTLLYDRYEIPGAGPKPTAAQREAFHWVPKLGALCEPMKKNHMTHHSADAVS
jgi:hypothetical protein